MSGREPAGYCKLEIRKRRGNIQVYVQDLKPAEQQNGAYEVYLISEDDKIEPIKLTSIDVDERGRGKNTVEFDVEDINGSGYSLDMFHALAVVFKSESAGGEVKVGYPLVGYSSRNVKIDWTGRITYHLKGSSVHAKEDLNVKIEGDYGDQSFEKQSVFDDEEAFTEGKNQEEDEGLEALAGGETEILAEDRTDGKIEEEFVKADINKEIQEESAKPNQEEEDNITAKQGQQEESMEADEIQLDDELQQAYQDTYKEFSEDIPPNFWQEDHEIGVAGEPPSVRQQVKDTASSKLSKDGIKGDYWDNVKDYFTGLFRTYRRIRPFEEDMDDTEWIRVPQQPPVAYPGYYAAPYYGQTYSAYNQMYYGGAYFDHYIVGLVRSEGKVKYVVYGIPSMYSAMPPTNMMGFSRWLPVKNGRGMGYWLAYIDASSGCVVYPYGKE